MWKVVFWVAAVVTCRVPMKNARELRRVSLIWTVVTPRVHVFLNSIGLETSDVQYCLTEIFHFKEEIYI